jgi:hypothetical protein
MYCSGRNKQDGLTVTRVRVDAVERLLANTTMMMMMMMMMMTTTTYDNDDEDDDDDDDYEGGHMRLSGK